MDKWQTLAVADYGRQLKQVAAIAERYLDNISQEPILPRGSYADLCGLLAAEVPWRETDLDSLLTEFEQKIIPHCTKIGHPRFLAWLLTGPSPAGTLGAMLADAVNQVPAMYQSSPAGTVLEEVVLRWFAELFGFSAMGSGLLTGGGTEATEIALAVAREVHFPGAMQRGFHGQSAAPIIYASDQIHSSVVRAASLLGIGSDYVRRIASCDRFRLDVVALRRQLDEDRGAGLRPFCVVAQVGTSTTGAVDPIAAIAGVCREEGLWLHVDAAYGGGAILTKVGRHLLAGVEQADSLATDPHKWFFIPAEAGCVLIRRKEHLLNTFGGGNGPQDKDTPPDLMNYGIQCTRAARAFKIWFAFRAQGLNAIAGIVEQNMTLAKEFQARLEATAGWEIVAPAALSAVCFRREPVAGMTIAQADQWQKDIVQRIAAAGEAFLTTANVRGRICIRVCFVNHRTTREDLLKVLTMLEAAAGSDAKTL